MRIQNPALSKLCLVAGLCAALGACTDTTTPDVEPPAIEDTSPPPLSGSIGVDPGTDDAGDGGPSGGADMATLGALGWTEQGEAFLVARFFATAYPPVIVVYAADQTSALRIDLYADLFNGAYEYAYWTDTYPFGFASSIGYARLQYTSGSSLGCVAATGGVTVSELGDPMQPIVATVTVDAWESFSSNGCPPTPLTGSFSIARNPDDSFGNDRPGDFFSLARIGGSGVSSGDVTYTENAATRYDPYMAADLSFPGATYIYVAARSNPALYSLEGGGGYEDYINIALEGSLGPGTYQVREFTVPGFSRFRETSHYTGNEFNKCEAKRGTITVTSAGGIGGRIEGTYAITEVEEITALPGSSCPASYSGSFSVTIEDY